MQELSLPGCPFPAGSTLHDLTIRVHSAVPTVTATTGLIAGGTLCGTWVGPAAPGLRFIVGCSASIPGRYVSIQARLRVVLVGRHESGVVVGWCSTFKPGLHT
jgi:hypothetical protein